MAKKYLVLVFAVMLSAAANAAQLAHVNLGDSGDSSYSLQGWSDRYWYPDHRNDNYGGGSSDLSWRIVISPGADIYGADGECDGNNPTLEEREATMTINVGSATVNQICLQSLDGIASDYGGSDTFDVYVEGIKVGTVLENGLTGEVWKTSCFSVPGATGSVDVKFTSTGAIWPLCSEYGQVTVSWVDLNGQPPAVGEPVIIIMLAIALVPPAMLLLRRKK